MDNANLSKLQMSHEGRLAHCESWLEQHQQEIEFLKKKQGEIHKLVTSVSVIAQKQTDMEKSVVEIKENLGKEMSDIKTELKAQREIPKKRWEKIWDYALRAAITALVGYALLQIGIG